MTPSGRYDFLVVGAGFAGSVTAQQLGEMGHSVLVVDRRPYVGGSAHDYVNDAGIRVHAHGAHVFHTNSQRVVDYLGRFTDWRPYEHEVLARVGDKLVPVPVNRLTVNELFGLDLQTSEQVEAFFASEAVVPSGGMRTSEDAVVGRIGRRLYNAIYRDYSLKHWNRPAGSLNASVAARIPFRTDDDCRYFTDWFQKMPAAGYDALFRRLLRDVDVMTGCSWIDARENVEYDHVVFTGPIDEFFDLRYGRLPWRSLRFAAVDEPNVVQSCGAVNVPSLDVPYIRTIEYRHLEGTVGAGGGLSTVHYEYPVDADEQDPPYYPVPCSESRALLARYQADASELGCVSFAGRLGRYQYLNIDQVVAQALVVAQHAHIAHIGSSG